MAIRSTLITGASKAIGFETALAFARAGWQVHATMGNPSGSPALSEVAAEEGLPIRVTAMDGDMMNRRGRPSPPLRGTARSMCW
jgi:NAD(P)-dependent dehydrogenase (short-subunit alcohol dehydrogenase family)